MPEISTVDFRDSRTTPASGWTSFWSHIFPRPAGPGCSNSSLRNWCWWMTRSRKASLRLRGGERIRFSQLRSRPLRAMAEDIPLDIVYEDADLAVVNKPAGMMVHAGAGATEDERNRGTLVNALLHHFGQLSSVGGELRPGSCIDWTRPPAGLIVVAKNDESHRRLAASLPAASQEKIYCAGARMVETRPRNHQQQHQPRPDAAHSHDHAAGGRPRGDQPLHRSAAAGFALRKVHAAGSADRHWAHAPDSRASWHRWDIRLWGTRCTGRGAKFAARKQAADLAPQKFPARGGACSFSIPGPARRCLSRPHCRRSLQGFLQAIEQRGRQC